VVDIEFLEPDADEPDAATAPEPAARPAGALATAARIAHPSRVVLWIGAAVLALLAPFRTIWASEVTSDTFLQHQAADGWGRYVSGGPGPVEHGPRYGIVLVACAALLAAAAVLAALAVLRSLPGRPVRPDGSNRPGGFEPPRSAWLRVGLATAGAAGLAAMAAVVLLQYLSTRDSLQAEARQFGARSPGNLLSTLFVVHVRLGACLWLCLAGLACALLGLAGEWIAVRAVLGPAATEPAPAADYAPEPVDPRDDLLETGPQPPRSALLPGTPGPQR
jgi:hypothetical protein